METVRHTRMKKLLDIVPYNYLPYFSGGQKSIAQFLEYLGKESELTVAGTITNDWKLAKNYIPQPLLKKGFSRYLDSSLVSKFEKIIKENSFDVVIWEHPYFDWLANRIRKRTGIKYAVHTHNIEFQRFRSNGRWWWPILRWYEKRCFKRANLLFFISDEDREFAINQWKINADKCFTVPFGVEISRFPSDKNESRHVIASKHQIKDGERILLFNGLLDYKPNLDALNVILNQVNPLLLSSSGFRYKIIICGKRLPKEMNELKAYTDKNIIFAGFVDDIDPYFKGADIFLNPVQSGGGIKTKMVESIAFGTTVIATESGAAGIRRSVCGDKLVVVPDNDWNAMSNAILHDSSVSTPTLQAYYDTYYWGSIVKKAVEAIETLK